MSNFKNYISRNNRKAEHKMLPEQRSCSCRNKENCPLKGKCLTSGVVYRAKLTRQDNGQQFYYTGATKNAFKIRYTKHMQSFRNHNFWDETALSVFIWTNLIPGNISWELEWEILAKSKHYNPATGVCNLCNMEKFFLLFTTLKEHH